MLLSGRRIGAWLLVVALTAVSWTGAARGQDALAVYQDAANFQNNQAYDLAEAEWEKFLKAAPQHELADKATQYLGVCRLQLKKYDKAEEAFAAVIKNFPKSPLLEEAHLNLAWSQFSQAQAGKEGMYAKAADSFAALIKAFPAAKSLDSAVFYQAEALYALGKKAEAAASYDLVVKNHPKSALRGDALYALGVTREELKQYPEAGQVYDLFLKEFAQNKLATEVQMRKAETIAQAGDYAAAEKLFAQVAATKDFASVDHALFRQAFCLAKLDKAAEAGAIYSQIPSVNPKSVYLHDAAMAAGRCFYRANNEGEATKWFKYVMDNSTPDASEAAHWTCRLLLRGKKAKEAADLAAAALPKAAGTTWAVHLDVDRADGLYENAATKGDAMAAYAKAATDNPQHEAAPRALYNAAFTALELKKFEDGVKYADVFVKTYDKDALLPDVKYVAAESNLQLKKYPEAEAGFRDLATNFAQHAEIDTWRVRLGLVLYLQKKYDEVVNAMKPLLEAIKAPELKAETQYLIGSSLYNTDKFDDAGAALAASLTADPKWRQADETLLLLSRVQRKANKLSEAKASVAKLIAEFPTSLVADQAHYRLGEYQFAADEFAPAVGEYDLVITKYPESTFVPYSLYGKGWSQLKLKKYPEATAAFTELLTKFKDHSLTADTHFARGMSRRQAGEAEPAAQDFDAFLATKPEGDRKADALYERGLAEVALKKFDAAAATFTSILTEAPKYPAADKVLYELGWALKSQDKHADAAPHFVKLTSEHPDSPLAAEAWFHIGEDQYEKKAFEEAVKSYSAAKSKAGMNELGEKSTYKLGWALFQLKQYDKSAAEFAAQTATYPQGSLTTDGVFMRAESLFRKENFKDAWPVFQAAVASKIPTPTIETLALLHGGQSASQLKQYKDAIGMLSQIPTKFPESPLLAETYYELGWAQQNDGKEDEALKSYETAATKSRDFIGARSRFMLGELYFAKKDFAAAIREFQRAMYGFGGDAASADTKNWQAKSGYEAGRCSQVQIDAAKGADKTKLIADAKKYYGFVVEKHPQHELAAEAKKQLDALAKLPAN